MDPNIYQKLPIPPLPRTQALNSKTFCPPPIDGSLTIPEMYDWHAKNTPDHPLFVFSDDEGNTTTINFPRAVKAMHRAGRLVQETLGAGRSLATKVPLLAVLANTDTVTYFTVIVGSQRAGFALFPVSPRNSPAAVAHLLTKSAAPYLLVGPELAMQELASHAFQIMQQAGADLPTTAEMPVFEDLYLPPDAPFKPLPPMNADMDDPVLIMHSSGSTAFPKPIVWSQYRYFLLGLAPYFGERDLTGVRFSAHCTPMYHAMGLIEVGLAACAGITITAFKPQSPARMLTEDAMIKSVSYTKSDIVVCVPSFVEAWAKNPEHVCVLQGVQGILFGGGPLNKEIGDSIVDKGVKLYNLYGASETGIMCCILPKDTGKDWEYITFPASVKTHFVPQENGNVELVIRPHAFQIPSVMNYDVDGEGAYNTNDVLAPHPTKPGYWKIFGRTDDQIMHSTGEKTNPGPLEIILQQDPLVKNAIMFGRGRFNAGVLIEPKEPHKFDPADSSALVAFRNKIWPTVERMNEYAPQHSRIFKEMITVSTPQKPFTYTAKNTPRRQAIIREYEPEIEALYAAVDESTQADLAPPLSWNAASAREFVRSVVNRVMDRTILDADDLFQSGCDSLQATWIRNSLLHALRDTTSINTRTIPGNFVYRYPTIAKLASFVSGLLSSDYDDAYVINDTQAIEEMVRTVDRYSSSFATHHAKVGAPEKDVVLLTGSTGGLGASLLADLISLDDVGKIYAVNRKAEEPLLSRQKTVLTERGLDADRIIVSPKVVFVESIGGDDLGLSADVLEEIRSSVTHIIHNAWPVNFNLSLTSFEPSVRVVRQLIDLALSSPHPHPATLLFISSVGVFRHIDLSKPVHEGPVAPSVAVGTGYSESKWISEQILKKAAQSTSLKTISVRVGQLTGSTSGAWKQTEWVPSMIRSSIYLKCLPTLDKQISWIPVDVAAKAVNEMRKSHISDILHLAHPRPVSWSAVMEPVAQELGLRMVPFDEWYALLEKSREGLHADLEVEMMQRNPALKILDFFAHAKVKMDFTPEAMGLPSLSTTHAQAAAPSLGPSTLPPLSAEDALRWLKYWRNIGAM